VESERRMLADALGQDTVDYLDRIGTDSDSEERAIQSIDESIDESIDIETGEIIGVG